MKTVDDFLSKDNPNYKFDDYNYDKIKDFMIRFAELHVQAAIEMCIEEAPSGSSTDTVSYEDVVEALTNCYPLTNIQ